MRQPLPDIGGLWEVLCGDAIRLRRHDLRGAVPGPHAADGHGDGQLPHQGWVHQSSLCDLKLATKLAEFPVFNSILLLQKLLQQSLAEAWVTGLRRYFPNFWCLQNFL